MKVERWEEESDEDWAERLTEEIALANNTETTKYFVERDSYAEENFIINYIGETGWTWKEHPEGPFSCKQVLEWKLGAEKWGKVIEYLQITGIFTECDESIVMDVLKKGTERREKLEAIKEQVITPQLKDSKEYLDTHEKPEPHDIEMSRYWLERGIYGTVSEIDMIIQSSDTTAKVEKTND